MTEQDHALALLTASLLRTGYGFVTVTPETHRRVNARKLNAVAQDVEGVFGWSRPFSAEMLAPDVFAWAGAACALVADGDFWRSRYRISTLDGLAFLHSAFPTQDADAVFFGPDTYRFGRALLHYLVKTKSRRCRVVDIGCGAGAGGMLIARAWPDAQVSMVDINPEALRLARINAAVAGLERIEIVRSDLLGELDGRFDLIVANPPYMADAHKRAYRDGGGRLGAGLSVRILEEAVGRLAPGGTLLLYTGTAIVGGANIFLQQAARLLADARFTWAAEEIDPDVFGEELEAGPMDEVDRIAVLWLTATRPLLDVYDA